MERLPQKQEAYSLNWFKAHAFDSIRPISPGKWDFSDSLLLYIPGSDESYENLQAEDSPYHKLVTAPERAYLESIATSVAKELPDMFEYIDLGPGTEHKEQFMFDALRAEGKSFVYRPADISKRFLSLSSEHATKQGIPVDPLHASFEELPAILRAGSVSRFVSLGLTYSNYEPAPVLDMLKQIAGPGGSAFINAQLRERTDMAALTEVYKEDAKGMIEGKIRLLGLDPATDVREQRITDEVRVWCTLANTNAALAAKDVQAGDELLIFQSLRPTKEALEAAIGAASPHAVLLDTGGSFVGAVIKAPHAD